MARFALHSCARFALVTLLCVGCAAQPPPEPEAAPAITIGDSDPPLDEPVSAPPAHAEPPLADGLVSEDLRVGDGDAVVSGSTIVVHYVGTLKDGSVFDSSRERGRPFSVAIGKNRVIRGWEEGVLGMRVGGVRRLTIPPEMGYGASGHPPKIPPSSTLVFEIELLAIE